MQLALHTVVLTGHRHRGRRPSTINVELSTVLVAATFLSPKRTIVLPWPRLNPNAAWAVHDLVCKIPSDRQEHQEHPTRDPW